MKILLTIVLILIALYLVVLATVNIYIIIRGYTAREARAVNSWFFVVSALGIFGYATSWIMFFPAWWFRYLGKKSWFWIWMDDSRYSDLTITGYAEDYEVFLDDHRETIWLAYKWHRRNRIWNLVELCMPMQYGRLTMVRMITDDLVMNGMPMDQMVSWAPMARLKYWKSGRDGAQVNNGDAISKKHSIFGTGFFWYTDNDKLYFRYSKLKIVNYGFWRGYRTIQMGTNARGYVSTIKHQKIKEIL